MNLVFVVLVYIDTSPFLSKALLELDRPATLSKAVALVCLPKQGQSVSAGHYCSVTGEFNNYITAAVSHLLRHTTCTCRNNED